MIDALPDPGTQAGLVLYIGLTALLTLLLKWGWDRWRAEDVEEVELAALLEETTVEDGLEEGQILDDIAEHHQHVIAPAAIEWDTRTARVGDQWTSTLYIADYPDHPKDGYLTELYELTDVEFDLTVHITPKSQQQARDELQRVADDLQADADLERTVRGSYLQERANEALSTYKRVENGSRVFEQGMFITVRADSRDQLRDAVRTVRSRLREQPAGLSPKTAICKQDLAIQGGSKELVQRTVFDRADSLVGNRLPRARSVVGVTEQVFFAGVCSPTTLLPIHLHVPDNSRSTAISLPGFRTIPVSTLYPALNSIEQFILVDGAPSPPERARY